MTKEIPDEQAGRYGFRECPRRARLVVDADEGVGGKNRAAPQGAHTRFACGCTAMDVISVLKKMHGP